MALTDHPDAGKIDEYRRKAAEAAAMAAEGSSELARESWMSIATSYQDMADRMERGAGQLGRWDRRQ